MQDYIRHVLHVYTCMCHYVTEHVVERSTIGVCTMLVLVTLTLIIIGTVSVFLCNDYGIICESVCH